MKRVIAALFLALTLSALCVCRPALAETRQQRKLVYVVIDDSGSMQTDNRWPRALYAMEALGGLLNPRDQLELYYLNYRNKGTSGRSDPYHWTADLSAQHIGDTMRKIVNTLDLPKGSTPFSSVERAYENMLDASRSEAFDQYWLVVMTDGEYNDSNVNPQVIRAKFESFTAEKIGPDQEGRLNLIYCTIGDNTYNINPTADVTAQLEDERIYCYSALNDQIVSVMGQIADRISGRSRFTGSSQLQQFDDHTIQVDSQIPLFNFVVLAQGTSARLVSAASDSGGLTISRSALIVQPGKSDSSRPLEQLAGGVYTVDNGQGHIEASTYTLTFDQPVTANQIIVLFEPALEVRLNQYAAGKLIGGAPQDSVHVGQRYEVSPAIMEYGTDRSIVLQQLPKGSALRTEITNGTRRASGSGASRIAMDAVEEAPVRVKAALSIPGFSDIVAQIEFDPIPKPQLSAAVPDDPARGVQSQALTARFEELRPGKKEKYLDFRITLNDSPAQDIQALLETGELSLQEEIACERELLPGGVLRLYPRSSDAVKLHQPYLITLKDREGALIAQATVTVLPSEFSVKIKPESITTDEAGLMAQPAVFEFTLVVDGKEADAAAYEPLTFVEAGQQAIALHPALDGQKWNVTAEYTPGMALGVYQFVPVFRGQQLAQQATLTLRRTEYAIAVKPEAVTLRQSELEGNQKAFEVTLYEGKKQLSPDAVTVDWGGLTPGADQTDGQKMLRRLSFTGNLTTEAKAYQLVLTYHAPTGAEVKKTVTMTVQESEYDIQTSPAQALVFNTASELIENQQEYRFDIRVDGRALTDGELQSVSSAPAVDRSDAAAIVRQTNSGYIVVPKAPLGWTPQENQITFQVSCSAGGKTATLNYYYSFVQYAVRCVQGQDAQLQADGLNKNEAGLAFRVYAEGQPLPYDMVYGHYALSAAAPFGRIALDSRVERDADGACTVYVTPCVRTNGFFYLFIRPFVPTGTLSVTLTYKNGQGTGSVEVLPGSLLHWLPHLIALVLILLAVAYYRKKRFGSGACMYYCTCSVVGNDIRGSRALRQVWWTKHLKPEPPWTVILPLGREKMTVRGLSVSAAAFGPDRQRRAQVEVYIKPGVTAKEIVELVSLDEPPNISNPLDTPAIPAGRYTMRDGSIIAVYGVGTQVTLFKYTIH